MKKKIIIKSMVFTCSTGASARTTRSAVNGTRNADNAHASNGDAGNGFVSYGRSRSIELCS